MKQKQKAASKAVRPPRPTIRSLQDQVYTLMNICDKHRRREQELLSERDWLRSIITGITVSRTGRPEIVHEAMKGSR